MGEIGIVKGVVHILQPQKSQVLYVTHVYWASLTGAAWWNCIPVRIKRLKNSAVVGLAFAIYTLVARLPQKNQICGIFGVRARRIPGVRGGVPKLIGCCNRVLSIGALESRRGFPDKHSSWTARTGRRRAWALGCEIRFVGSWLSFLLCPNHTRQDAIWQSCHIFI